MIRAEDLFENDGIDYLSKRRDEILAEIVLPASSDASHCRSSFWKLRRRGTIDFAVLTVAAVVWFDDRGRVENASVHLGAVGSRPLRVPGVMDRLRGSVLDADAIAEIGTAARRVATPMDNTDFHTQWRGVMTARYTEAAMREIAGVDPGLDPPRHSLLS